MTPRRTRVPPTPTVLVTDGSTRAALAATRALGRRYRVVVLASEPRALAAASRFAAAGRRVPDPGADPAAFARRLVELARAEDAAVVLPITDAACASLIPRARELLPTRLAAPAEPAWRRLSDKAAAVELARAFEVPVPETRVAEDPGALRAAARELGPPVVLKAARSVVVGPDGVLRRPPVVRAASAAQVEAALPQFTGAGPVLVQESVPGHGEGLFVVRVGERTLGAFAHRRVREKPPEGGVSVLSESIAVDEAMQRRIEAILDAAGFEGAVMAEFRRDGDRRWLLEFNPRLWGSLQLALDAGVDFPGALVAWARGEAAEVLPAPRTGVRLRSLLGDLDHALALARGARDTRGRGGWRAALAVLLRPTGAATRFEILRASDPRPFATAIARWLRGESL